MAQRRDPFDRDQFEIWRDRIFGIAATFFVGLLIWLDFADDGSIQNQWLFILLAVFGSGATTWWLYRMVGRRNGNGNGSNGGKDDGG